MREEVQWINLTWAEIAGRLVQHGMPVSVIMVRPLLKHQGHGPCVPTSRSLLCHLIPINPVESGLKYRIPSWRPP